MPLVVICPRCTSQLGLPSDAAPGAQLECPVCEVEFAVDAVSPRELLLARIVAHSHLEQRESRELEEDELAAAAPPLAAPAATQESLSRLLRATANWQPAPAVVEPASLLRETFEAPERDDAEPAEDESAEIESTAAGDQAPAGDSLKLGSSRLDQLLSDLMKRPVEPLPPNGYQVSGVYVEEQYPPTTVSASQGVDSAADSREVSSSAASPYEHDQDAANRDVPGMHRPATNGNDFHRGSFAERSNEADAYEDASEFPDHADDDRSPADLGSFPDDHDGVSLDLYAPQPRRGRRLAALAACGAMMLLALNYGLLWLRGPGGDLLAMARWLPSAAVPAAIEVADAAGLPESAASGAPRSPAMEAAAKLLATANRRADGANASPSVGAAESPTSAPVEPSAHADQPRYDPAVAPATATEPANAPPPSAVATWPTTPIVGDIQGAKLYSVEELRALTSAADSARQQFLAGDLARVESRGAMGQAFMDVCALAERFTLADPAAYGNELVTEQLLAKDVFRAVAGDPARRGDLAIIAARWLQHERRQNQGVLLLGRVVDMRPQGKWTEYIVEVGSGDAATQCLVLLDRIRFPIGSEIAIAGAIITDPLQRIARYQGAAPQVVVAGFTFPPEDFTAPAGIGNQPISIP